MPLYDDIHAAILGSRSQGLYRWDQGERALRQGVDIGEGVCQGLVVEWLLCEREERSFRRPNDVSVYAQRFYEQGISSRDGEGLPYTVGRLLETRGYKWKSQRVCDWEATPLGRFGATWQEAAGLIMSASFNFFNITFEYYDPNHPLPDGRRDLHGHAIGVHRPYKTIGNSDYFNIFDPNCGEFEVRGTGAGVALRMLLEGNRGDHNRFWHFCIDGIQLSK